jgi:hypothetical protein
LHQSPSETENKKDKKSYPSIASDSPPSEAATSGAAWKKALRSQTSFVGLPEKIK